MLAIIDYKAGADKLDVWKMRNGVKMQLMIYLISASTGEMEPAGMFYFNIKDPMESINDKTEKSANTIIDREAEDEFKLKGAFVNEEGVLEAMPPEVLANAKKSVSREEYEEIRSDVISRIEETASGILGGKIDIKPLRNDNRLVCSYCSLGSVCRRDRLDRDLVGIVKPQGELVAVDAKLHGVSHWSQLDHGDFGAGDQAHVQKVLSESALPAYSGDNGRISDVDFFQCHIGSSFICIVVRAHF